MSHAQAPSPYRRISLAQLAERLAGATPPDLIDLREPHEWDQGGLPLPAWTTARRLPLSELRSWWPALDPEREQVLVCQRGNRSRALCQALAAAGFGQVWDLEGGVEGCGEG